VAALRVLVVDDHALFRDGLVGLLSAEGDVEVVGEAGDGLEALVKAKELKPDLILMDVTMPGCDGLEATQRIKAALPEVKIVMLTVHDDDENLFEAIKAGAEGYLLKSVSAETLMQRVRGVMHGQAAISRSMAARILDEFGWLARQAPARGLPDRPALTPRQKDVLRLVAAGAMDKEIADELCISINTVKTHVRNILSELHAAGRHEAAAYAERCGLIHPTKREEPGGD
jgi:two-component system NarL family response regulator